MQLDGLVAELTSALSLEEFELGGGGNDESFLMVSEGVGGRHTPVGAVSGESSSSLRLPPRVPACAGRGIWGGGGGDLDRGSSTSPSLGQRGDSSSPAPAGSRQARVSPTSFWPVRLEGRGSLAWRSMAAQDLARVGMRFNEGTGASSNTPPRLKPTSALLNLVPVNKSTKSHLFLLTQEDISSQWCLGHISGGSGTRFCMGKRLLGKTHCGVKCHALPERGGTRYKFCPHADCFFIPDGVPGGKPFAKKDLFLHWRDVQSHKRNTFLNAMKTLAEWTTLFDDTLHELENKDAKLQEDEDVERDEIFGDNPTSPPSRGQHNKIQFSWDLGEDDAPQGSPSPAHRAALELLQSACDDQVARS
jgi:hypothetical protein